MKFLRNEDPGNFLSLAQRNMSGTSNNVISKSQNIGSRSANERVTFNYPTKKDHERLNDYRKLAIPREVKPVVNHFDENAMLASVRQLPGAKESCNRYLERRWTKIQNGDEKKTLMQREEEKPKTSDVFAKNIGMRAIMQQRENDAQYTLQKKNIVAAANGKQYGQNVGATSSNKFPFVEDAVDSDFLLRKYMGVSNDEDYIVEHVGKIVRTSARKFIIENTNDDSFVFSRDNTTAKSSISN